MRSPPFCQALYVFAIRFLVAINKTFFLFFFFPDIIEDLVIPFRKNFCRKLPESGSVSKPKKCDGYCPRNLKSSRGSTMMVRFVTSFLIKKTS
jgi:hypothetical protein